MQRRSQAAGGFASRRFLEFDGADFRLGPPRPTGEDLLTLWKARPTRRTTLPARAKGPVRAQLKPGKELGWSGGKAGNT